MEKAVRINYQKAKEIAKKAISAKKEGNFPFNKEQIFPDAIVPINIERGSKEHALFLFHSISIDSMRQATYIYKVMRELTECVKDLSKISKIKRRNLEKILAPYLGEEIKNPKNSMTDPVGTILHNAKKLEEEYENDPRLLKEGGVEETLDRIDKFKQYGVPKAALLIKNYVRFGIWPFSEEEIPIKIDRHTMRINLGCKVIDLNNHIKRMYDDGEMPKALRKAIEQLIGMRYYKEEDFNKGIRVIRSNKFIGALTETYLRITKEEKISAIDLDDALWGIGAYSCKKNNAIYCDLSCPLPCETRNPSDNNAVWFFIDVDKRRNINHLFKKLKR